MSQLERKNFSTPDETRTPSNTKIEVVKVGGKTVLKATFQPGWRWSESLKPMVHTDSCQVSHFGYMVSGRMGVKMEFFGAELALRTSEPVRVLRREFFAASPEAVVMEEVGFSAHVVAAPACRVQETGVVFAA